MSMRLHTERRAVADSGVLVAYVDMPAGRVLNDAVVIELLLVSLGCSERPSLVCSDCFEDDHVWLVAGCLRARACCRVDLFG